MRTLVFGSASTLLCTLATAQTVHHHVVAPLAETGFGACAGIDDWNGDGHDDFVVGAFLDPTQGADAGRVTVYSGLTGGVLDQFFGQAGDRVGYSVGNAGDVDGNGFGDIIVGALDNPGYAAVIGGPSGTLLELWTGVGTTKFGVDVAGAGDVNSDGFDDVIVGESWNTTGGPQAGAAHVYSGRYIAQGVGAQILHSFYGTAGAQLGFKVDGAGDVDGDGVPDLLACAPTDVCTTMQGSGTVYVYSGTTGAIIHSLTTAGCTRFGHTAAIAGDTNLDGHADILVGAPSWGPTGSVLLYSGATGLSIGQWYGAAVGDDLGYAVSGAGDVNGDGIPDVLLGAYWTDATASDSGSAYLYSGAGGLLHRFDGLGADDQYGVRVAAVGDVNHDGLADVIIGANQPTFSNPGQHGYAQVVGWECQGEGSTYCLTAPNSNGAGAFMSWSGSTSISVNALNLQANRCAVNVPGLFFYGPNQIQVPFGDGWRCVGGQTFRLYPAVMTNAAGHANQDLDFTQSPVVSGAGQINPFSAWNFQFWFRDPMGPGGNGFNLTDGLSIEFCP